MSGAQPRARASYRSNLDTEYAVLCMAACLRGVPFNAFVRAGSQRAGAERQGQLSRCTLVLPVQAVLLFEVGHRRVAHYRLRYVQISGRGQTLIHSATQNWEDVVRVTAAHGPP